VEKDPHKYAVCGKTPQKYTYIEILFFVWKRPMKQYAKKDP